MEDVIGRRQWEQLTAGTERRCVATNRSGERCGKAPIVGGFVCVMHGGRIPSVQKAARERLLAASDLAVERLVAFLHSAPPCANCGRSDADRDPLVLRAAQLVLDRTGFHPTMQVEVRASNPFADLSEDELIERLQDVLAEAVRNRELRRAHTHLGRPLPRVESAPIQIDAVPIPVENRTGEEGIEADVEPP
jgi:hypothetical protein